MTLTTTVEVFGAKEALKELKNVEPDTRKAINARAKDIVKPATDAIKQEYPPELLSGMRRAWVQRGRQLFPYDQSKARKGVKLKVDTKKKATSVMAIVQDDPAAAIVDMAGKAGGGSAQGARFIAALTAMFGQPSRVMWPTYEKNSDGVAQNMQGVMNDVMAAVGKRLI
jgi:hypothetical protein